MKDKEMFINLVRQFAEKHTAAQVAEFIVKLDSRNTDQFIFIESFRLAFPEIPFQKIIQASGWSKICGGGFSDDYINDLLKEWIPCEPGNPMQSSMG